MNITQLHIKQFRCFSDMVIPCNYPAVLLVGNNGTGKTSILEALHYMCYLRSFRTHTPKDLIQFDKDTFFIKLMIDGTKKDAGTRELQVGFSTQRRLVKMDQKAIASYKDLLDHYRVVTITEDDLELIKGGPDYRRAFVDQALFLVDHSYTKELRTYKKILENRNALLTNAPHDATSYKIWTEQLFEASHIIVQKRIAWLAEIEKQVQKLLCEYVDPDLIISIAYQSKKQSFGMSLDQFMEDAHLHALREQEIRFKRTLFGAHLDDIVIHFQGKKSRQFASRGQQKLVTLLIKIAHIQTIQSFDGLLLFLLDDFMTDFDEARVNQLIPLLFSLGCQLIFTSPTKGKSFESELVARGAYVLDLTHSNI